MDLAALSLDNLALRTVGLKDQLQAAEQRGEPEAWKQAALAIVECLEEHNRRLGNVDPTYAADLAAMRARFD